MWWYGHAGMGWWMVFGGILMVLFWALIIWLVIWGIRKATEDRRSGTSSIERREALDIARERYARGEITKEQFEQLKRDLS